MHKIKSLEEGLLSEFSIGLWGPDRHKWKVWEKKNTCHGVNGILNMISEDSHSDSYMPP